MLSQTLLIRCLEKYLRDFLTSFWGEKIEVEGDSRVNNTLWVEVPDI